MKKQERADRVLERLSQAYPEPPIPLDPATLSLC